MIFKNVYMINYNENIIFLILKYLDNYFKKANNYFTFYIHIIVKGRLID